jgi:hypothetical protein
MSSRKKLGSLFTFRRPSAPAVLTPSRHPLNAILPSSRSSPKHEGVLNLNFPLGWGTGQVHEWYLRRMGKTAIKSIEVRKEYDTFQHEYILIRLQDGSILRIDRRPDPSVPIDTIMRKGCDAVDTISELETANDLAPSRCVVSFRPALDVRLELLHILMICYAIKNDDHSRRYSLQKFNCHFFSWTIFLVSIRNILPVSQRQEDYSTRLRVALDHAQETTPSPRFWSYELRLWRRAKALALNALSHRFDIQLENSLWDYTMYPYSSDQQWRRVLIQELTWSKDKLGALVPFHDTNVPAEAAEWLAGAISSMVYQLELLHEGDSICSILCGSYTTLCIHGIICWHRDVS